MPGLGAAGTGVFVEVAVWREGARGAGGFVEAHGSGRDAGTVAGTRENSSCGWLRVGQPVGSNDAWRASTGTEG